uniref:NADH-ubiquinone oxidoreductase chain 6 n=1 Tax=Damithrax spinosissimus TaxID=765936 RepID=A0A0U1XG54_DAMSP|nr:NADH dehydrogenase subunit 6 [Damithrax spinosissimus]AIT75858.1 NADH dehydrogenase subunit 6 [Damithrax spinosissimus]
MTLFIIPFIISFSFLFTRLFHPLSLGLVLLIQTILISLNTGISTYSFWFSYILFLIFLGGMLVLFIYVASLASNEFFKFSLSLFLFFIFFLTLTALIFLISDSIFLTTPNSTPPSNPVLHTSTMFIISWIYSPSLMKTTLFIIFYLLFTLIVVVKITNLFKGPLRLFN